MLKTDSIFLGVSETKLKVLTSTFNNKYVFTSVSYIISL